MGRLRVHRLGEATPLRVAAGPVVAARCRRAERPLARLVGLLGTPDLRSDEALWLSPCASVHTAFLRAAIGCAFLDPDGRVLRVVDPLPRWRAAACPGAAAAVECAAGVLTAATVRPGTVLWLGDAKNPLGAVDPPRDGG
jgi:uncharacterized membrane protein (UPF0127 family)